MRPDPLRRSAGDDTVPQCAAGSPGCSIRINSGRSGARGGRRSSATSGMDPHAEHEDPLRTFSSTADPPPGRASGSDPQTVNRDPRAGRTTPNHSPWISGGSERRGRRLEPRSTMPRSAPGSAQAGRKCSAVEVSPPCLLRARPASVTRLDRPDGLTGHRGRHRVATPSRSPGAARRSRSAAQTAPGAPGGSAPRGTSLPGASSEG